MLVTDQHKNLSLAILVMAGWMIACSSARDESAPAIGGLPKPDASAYLACRLLAAMIQEQGDGVLNDAELRGRMKAVYEKAKGLA
jgi:hypothetical protein